MAKFSHAISEVMEEYDVSVFSDEVNDFFYHDIVSDKPVQAISLNRSRKVNYGLAHRVYRCEALANQINPHFFFNSLNGLTALVREDKKESSLEYIAQLSNVFRYILQSDKKGLVTLKEELQFVNSFAYLQEVRYADKLHIIIDVPDNKQNLRLPVLSLLPLIENVVKHNVVDSDNRMTIWFDSRLLIKLDFEPPERIYISKNKAAEFKQWMTM